MTTPAPPPPTPRARVALVVGYAVVTFLAFPHPVGGGVLDLGLVCGWLSPALLLLALDGLRPGAALRVGFGAGLVAHAAILHWLWVVTVVYGHAPALAGVAAPLGLGAFVAAFTALFAGLVALLARVGMRGPFAAALAWTAIDHLRSFAATGFPWATLGYSQHQNPALLGLAAFTGVYGLSAVVALGGGALAAAVRDLRAGRAPGIAVYAALACVVGAHVLGLAAGPAPDDDAPRVRVAVLQGNIDQGVKWDPDWGERTLEIYADLTREAAERGAEVVVWPETAVPGAADADPGLRARLSSLAREAGTALVIGLVGLELAPGSRDPLFYDSAALIGPDGSLLDRYDKAHLVPFGEYVPFRDLLGGVLSAVARGIASRDVAAGEGPRGLTLPLGSGGSLTAGVPICYELLFPDLVRRFVADGGQVLFGITNDAWYGRTGAPYQFLAITAMRSAETRVWTARAANTGVSAFIDAGGRVRARTSIFERDLLIHDVPLRAPPAGGSFYTRHGDVFASACWLLLPVLGLAGWRRTGGRSRP